MKVGPVKVSVWTMVKVMLASMAGAVLNALLPGALVMLLWNWIVPAVFPRLPAS